MAIQKDTAALSASFEAGIKDILNSAIDGAITELDGPVREASNLLMLATRHGDMGMVAEAQDQLYVIALNKGLRLKQGGMGLFETILGVGMNALVNGAIGGIASLKIV